MRLTDNNNNNTVRTGGVSFIGLLQIAFIVLKLCGVIDWSWWLVLAPIWGSFALVFLIFVIAIIIMKLH